MAIYSLALRGTGAASATPQFELRTTATDRPRVMEVGISIAAATSSQFGLGRPGAIGVTPTAPVTGLAEDPGDAAGTVTAALAWGTAPTVPTNFFRRISTPATIGAGVIWTFPQGLIVAVSNSIVVWNIGTNSVSDIWMVWDE